MNGATWHFGLSGLAGKTFAVAAHRRAENQRGVASLASDAETGGTP